LPVKLIYTLFAMLLFLTGAEAAPQPNLRSIDSADYADSRSTAF